MINEITIAIIVGVAISLLFTEKTGILPAGLVVPGYIALTFNEPIYVVSIFFISFATYLFVTKVLARFMIIYGKRKFTAMQITGILLKISFDALFAITPLGLGDLQAIGIIVPGLIANTIQKQGVMPTVSSTMLISLTTFGVLTLYSTFLI